MHFQSTILSAAALFAAVASAQISIGTITNGNNIYNLAWATGTDPCTADAKYLSTNPTSPCGKQFSLGSEGGYTFEGCGGSNLWINQWGTFKYSCSSAPTLDKSCNNYWVGNVHKIWQCPV